MRDYWRHTRDSLQSDSLHMFDQAANGLKRAIDKLVALALDLMKVCDPASHVSFACVVHNELQQ